MCDSRLYTEDVSPCLAFPEEDGLNMRAQAKLAIQSHSSYANRHLVRYYYFVSKIDYEALITPA